MLSAPIYINDEDLDPEDRPTDCSAQEALYDPLEDDDNQKWVQNNLLRASPKKKLPTLSCPCCFRQLAFTYKQLSPTEFLVTKPYHI